MEGKELMGTMEGYRVYIKSSLGAGCDRRLVGLLFTLKIVGFEFIR